MEDKKSKEITTPKGKGTLQDLVLRLKLIVRLMGDNRVSPFLKILPVASLVYLFYPFDLISIVPGLSALDDMAIVSLGAYLFVEFCPPDVVQEHMRLLGAGGSTQDGEVVEGQATDIYDDK